VYCRKPKNESFFVFLLILAILFDNFFMQKRHVCEIGQCFGELYLKAMYFSSTYLVLFLSMWDQTWLFFHYFLFLFCFMVSKKGWIVGWFFFLHNCFFSVAVFGFFWLLYLFNFIQSFWNSTIIIYKVMYNRDHECHQMVKCIIIIFLFVSLVIQTSYYPTNYLHLDKNHS